jgi:hypothetical protein
MTSLPKENSKSMQLCILLILLIFASTYVYRDIASLSFARADDGWMLLGNKLVNKGSFSLSYIKEVFLDTNGGQYSPINTIYYYIIHQLFGYNAQAFHFISIFIHFLNGYLVYLFTKKIGSMFRIHMHETFAITVSCFWLIHPMNIEPVIWISASKVLLFSCFSLLSLIFMLKTLDENKNLNYIISAFFFLLSCFCKEQAIVLPSAFICIRYLYHQKREITQGKIRWFLFITINGLIALLFLIIFLKLNNPDSALRKPALAYNWFERINLVIYCMSFYITNFFIPISLKLFYPFPFKPGQSIPIFIYLYNVCFVFSVTIAFIVNRKNNQIKFYLASTLFFAVNIIVVLQIFSMNRESITADRYLYMPSVGLLLLFIGLFFEKIKGATRKSQYALLSLASCIGLFFIIYSSTLVRKWQVLNISKEVYDKGLPVKYEK